MLWGNRVRITQSNRNSEHFHDLHELVVCLSDTGDHTIDGRSFVFRRGRTFLLPGGIPHRVLPPEDGMAEIVYVCFDQEALVGHTPPQVSACTRALIERRQFVSAEDEAICRENVGFAPKLAAELDKVGRLSQAMAGAMLSALLVNHWRSLQAEGELGTDAAASAIGRICRDVVSRPSRQVSIDLAARSVGMSRASFTRQFRAQTGMSFTEYVRSVRLKAAMGMLAGTSADIVDIALECGFINLGYFYRSFRRQTQMTPRQYRKEAHEKGRPVQLLVESERPMPTMDRPSL